MAIKEILHYPDPRLRIKAAPVAVFDDALQVLIDDLFETMYHARGVGLAATQVGVNLRIAVMDTRSRDDDASARDALGADDGGYAMPMVIINPEYVGVGEKVKINEGCLSVPDYADDVPRYPRVQMTALDRHGKTFQVDATELLSQAIQHEIDHLDGKLYIDMLSSLKRDRLKKRVSKNAR